MASRLPIVINAGQRQQLQSGDTIAPAAIADATVSGKLITGFSALAGVVAATDSILQAINKIVGNILNIDPSLNGWIPLPALTYASSDSPTFTCTASGDITGTLSKGMKLKLQQSQALTNYWSFDTDSTDQIAGTTMTNIGTPTYTAGKFSNALTLNGSSQALKCADNTFKPTGDYTIIGWLKPTNATATKLIFQSWRDTGTVFSGIMLQADITTGFLIYFSAKNTGQVLNVDYSVIHGKINISDNAEHYIVITFSAANNWLQIYVDGKLDISGYCITPVYNATTYTRIGVYTPDGSTNSSWFIGQIDDLVLINGYALDEKTIHDKYIASTAQGTGNITVTKNFLITDISYANPNTTITCYGGTDFSLASATISNPYYSMIKCPYGFNLNPDKWSVIFTNNLLQTVGTPTVGTLYNMYSIVSPIGLWNGGYETSIEAFRAITGYLRVQATLSTTSNAESNIMFTGLIGGYEAPIGSIKKTSSLVCLVKTTIYFNIWTDVSSVTNIYVRSDYTPTIIKIISAYI